MGQLTPSEKADLEWYKFIQNRPQEHKCDGCKGPCFFNPKLHAKAEGK